MSGGAVARRVQNVYLVAEEPGRLHDFYEKALGLQLKFRDGERWIQYKVGDGNVSIASQEEGAPATSGLVMVLEVDEDLDSARAGIEAAGGQVVGQRDMGSHGAVLSLRDPEGNLVQLFRRAPAAA